MQQCYHHAGPSCCGQAVPVLYAQAAKVHRHRTRVTAHPPGASSEAQPMATLDRRQLLAASMLIPPLLAPQQALAAADSAVAPAAAAAAAAPPLPQVFNSTEGFAFRYPSDWVVAFDRSGGRGNGAVMVVGNFRTFDTVSVFRTEVPAADLAGGMTEELGYRLAVEAPRQEASTMRFELLGSALSPAGSSSSGGPYFDYEYSIEMCRGEIIEASGGRIQCLGPQGQDLQTLRRHHLGRAVAVGGNVYTFNASAPEDRWPALQSMMAAIVASFGTTR